MALASRASFSVSVLQHVSARSVSCSSTLHASPEQASTSRQEGSAATAQEEQPSTLPKPLNLASISQSLRLNTKLQVHGDLSYELGAVPELQRRQEHYLELLLAKARLGLKQAQAEGAVAPSLLRAMQQAQQAQQQEQEDR